MNFSDISAFEANFQMADAHTCTFMLVHSLGFLSMLDASRRDGVLAPIKINGETLAESYYHIKAAYSMIICIYILV